jgi:uncharacterized protein (DUF58 family)
MIKKVDIDINRLISQEVLYVNKPVNIVLELKNKSSTAYFEIEDQIPTGWVLHKGSNKYSSMIHTEQEIKIKYSIISTERGTHDFSITKIKLLDKNKLFQCNIDAKLISKIRVDDNIDVIIKSKAISKRDKLRLAIKAKDEKTKIRGHEFDRIRSYLPGDSLKDIEWKTTSRLLKLMTKVYEEETTIPVSILLDCSKSMRKTTGKKSKMDHSIKLSFQLIKIFQGWEHPIGLIAFDEYKILFNITSSTNKMQIERIYKQLRNIPENIFVNEYDDLIFKEHLNLKNDREEHFIGVVGPFLTKQKTIYSSATKATGIYEAIRTIITSVAKKQFLLLISDLESNTSPLYDALKLIKKYKHKIVIITPFTHLYDYHPKEIPPTLLEEVYRSYTQKQKIIKKFRSLNIEVIEITPPYQGRRIIQELERYPR